MQCEQIQRDLVAYQAGSLSPQERAAIEAHLSTCEACAEEAALMKETSELLTKGLKDWVDQGVCPPDIAERIELNLREASGRPWWQRWPALVGVVATVAAVFLVAVATNPDIAHKVASVPLLGAIAAQLASPELDFQVDPQKPVSAALFKPTRTVDLNVTAVQEDATLTVVRVSTDEKLLRVQYSVAGEGLVLGKDELSLIPRLTSPDGPVALQSYTADQKDDEIRFVAYFDAVPAGASLTLTVPSLELRDGGTRGPWQVAFTN